MPFCIATLMACSTISGRAFEEIQTRRICPKAYYDAEEMYQAQAT
jgi:hypothetical protein